MGIATWDAGWARIVGATLMKGVPSARAAPYQDRPRTTPAATRANLTALNARLSLACGMSVQPYAAPLLTRFIGSADPPFNVGKDLAVPMSSEYQEADTPTAFSLTL